MGTHLDDEVALAVAPRHHTLVGPGPVAVPRRLVHEAHALPGAQVQRGRRQQVQRTRVRVVRQAGEDAGILLFADGCKCCCGGLRESQAEALEEPGYNVVKCRKDAERSDFVYLSALLRSR